MTAASRKEALRVLRQAAALVRERSRSQRDVPPGGDAPLVIVMVDEVTELARDGRYARRIRRELSRLAALGRSENVAVFTRAPLGLAAPPAPLYSGCAFCDDFGAEDHVRCYCTRDCHKRGCGYRPAGGAS
jgi:hypothetical protein